MLGLHHLGGGWGWGCFSGEKLLGFFFSPPEERGDLEAVLHLYNYITTHRKTTWFYVLESRGEIGLVPMWGLVSFLPYMMAFECLLFLGELCYSLSPKTHKLVLCIQANDSFLL